MSYVTTTFKVVTLLRKFIEVDMCTSVMLREGGLKSVHFKKTVARISIVVLFVLICIESNTILKESRFAQLSS